MIFHMDQKGIFQLFTINCPAVLPILPILIQYYLLNSRLFGQRMFRTVH